MEVYFAGHSNNNKQRLLTNLRIGLSNLPAILQTARFILRSAMHAPGHLTRGAAGQRGSGAAADTSLL